MGRCAQKWLNINLRWTMFWSSQHGRHADCIIHGNISLQFWPECQNRIHTYNCHGSSQVFLSCMHCWGLGFWLMSTKYIVESSAAFWAWCYNYEGEDFLACIIVVLKQEVVFRMAALIFKKGSSATLHWFGPVHSLLGYELTNFGSISEKG